MRAACYERTGPAREVLEVRDLPEPSPTTGEVRVRMHVSGVNPTDWKSRSYGPPLSWPLQVPHHDGAGVVDTVGEHCFPLEAVADAHEAVERGVLGKVLVELT